MIIHFIVPLFFLFRYIVDNISVFSCDGKIFSRLSERLEVYLLPSWNPIVKPPVDANAVDVVQCVPHNSFNSFNSCSF